MSLPLEHEPTLQLEVAAMFIWISRRVFICLLLAVCSCGRQDPVSLTIVDASAEQKPNYLSVSCTASLENRTGSSLVVTSEFYSAFDGLRLVMTSEEGKRLAEQRYVLHQSPYAIPGRPFTLHSGVTTQHMMIPISLTNAPAKVKVQLIGVLPGSSYTGEVASTVITVPVRRVE